MGTAYAPTKEKKALGRGVARDCKSFCNLNCSQDAFPLLLVGIYSCWIVSTDMQDHNGAFRGSLKSKLNHSKRQISLVDTG